ncbi:hypothetical protein [Halobacillus sp. A5]|uniref:hypothetical protein n=1 Tax=Halobacillus sp. A5 TaxID=2880263 RepID=UPI0020A622D7|nr:hypothetical protein [Halobacillus sp. A5]MCP3025384.1 hypothetical protein [Halobacillus sp. A5]
MKKILILLLAGSSLIVWTITIILLITADSGQLDAGAHSSAYHTGVDERKSIDVHRISLTEGKEVEKAETVLGQQTISENMADDMSVDGKISIDTLLKALDIGLSE